MRLGLFDHLGWAVAVLATPDGEVLDRRRIELVPEGLSAAPIHYDRGRSSDADVAALIDRVRASAAAMAASAFDDLPPGVRGVALRTWPADVPADLTVLRRAPWEARADAVMYRRILADVAEARGWAVHLYDAKRVVAEAEALLGDRSVDVLDGPRRRLGPPWTKDHKPALAAAVLAATGT